ncbi:hypothetical protein BB561_001167 [Smittium simulii]|uniref:sphingomyelin phosphodiesterase n=1 Tax=Smittium simulii TaxID=133385 RepID=A0A2T9YVT0_9FUNG|nr:hypothetical protein BB561_001167 [Smittium simulii]
MSSSLSVRLLTQNIFIRPPGINTNGNDYKSERKALLESKILPEYDIVCLQEMFRFGSYRHSSLVTEAKKLGFEYCASSPSKGLFSLGIDAGLMILSKHKIVYSEFSQYERGVQSDALSLKGVLYARINLSPTKPKFINVYTTHTQASYGDVPLTHPSVKKRLSQISQLRTFIDKTILAYGNPGEPLFLVGDMNVDSRTHKSEHKTPNQEPASINHETEQDGTSSSLEYEAMMGILRGDGIKDPSHFGIFKKYDSPEKIPFIDSLYNHLGYHPITSGNTKLDENGNLVPMETVLTSKNDNMAMKSLDYIFVVTPSAQSEPQQESDQPTDSSQVCENKGPETFFIKENTSNHDHAESTSNLRKSDKSHPLNLVIIEAKSQPNFVEEMPFIQISDHYEKPKRAKCPNKKPVESRDLLTGLFQTHITQLLAQAGCSATFCRLNSEFIITLYFHTFSLAFPLYYLLPSKIPQFNSLLSNLCNSFLFYCIHTSKTMGQVFAKLFNSLWGEQEVRILILGLDGAGKTTILYRLQVGEVVSTIPTIGFNVETLKYKNLKIQGQTSIRPYWRCYYANTDAIIFVVDSVDRDRIGISREELNSMLEEEELNDAILLVFANKQDVTGAMTAAEISESLGLTRLKNRQWAIYRTSAIKGEGLSEGLDW